MVGVSQTSTCGDECIDEVPRKLAMDNIGSAGIEIAAEECGRVREISGMLQDLPGVGEFLHPEDAVHAVIMPSGRVPQPQICSSGAEVDVDDFKSMPAGSYDCNLVVTLVGITHFPEDLPAADDAIGLVGSIVAMTTVEDIRHLA